MNAMRRCALALHGVHPDDREWVLAQLPGAAQATLRDLLLELSQLGIPVDDELTLDAVGPREPVAPPVEDLPPLVCDLPPTPYAYLQAASVRDVAAVLTWETPVMVATVLRAGAWPWSTALLRRLPRLLRHEVREALFEDCPLPPALAQTCIHALASQVHTHVASQALSWAGWPHVWAGWQALAHGLARGWRTVAPEGSRA